MIDKDSVIKSIYFLGAVYQVGEESSVKGWSTVVKIKKWLAEKIEEEKKCERVADDFQITDEELQTLIQIYFRATVMLMTEHVDKNGERTTLEVCLPFDDPNTGLHHI
jgi:hypothetical protein